MGHHMGIILGLVAAIFWGAADFFARYATQRIGTYRTLFYMQLFGLVGLSIYLLATGAFSRFAPTDSRYWQPWLWALSTAVLSVFSTLALYRAFEVGVLTIVSPIAASSSALTLVLSFLNGEIISLVQGLGIGAALIGIVLAATSFAPTATALNAELVLRQKRKQSSGIGWALLASVGFGVIFWMLGFHVTPFLGGITPVWLIRLMAVCLLALLASPMRQTIIPPRGPVWWYITGVGILDTAAFVIAAIALGNGQEVAIVSVLVSLFSAVTVVLAWIFLHEKLHWSQWLGICIIFVGIVLVNI
jgi:drug/metabolite transporter (DMT)-like permease